MRAAYAPLKGGYLQLSNSPAVSLFLKIIAKIAMYGTLPYTRLWMGTR